jgi:alpha-L-rhamnosidase
MMMEIVNLRCEYMANPLGIGVKTPRFCWEIVSGIQDTFQTAYQIRAALGGELVWDSGKTPGENSVHVLYSGRPLQSGRRYDWQLTVWDNHNNEAGNAAWFETGLLDPSDWTARWIVPQLPPAKREPKAGLASMASGKNKKALPVEKRLNPCSILRREFVVTGDVKKVRVYATAHGCYSLEINGKRADDREFAPEFSDYRKILFYQTYDVTALLRRGENTIGAVLSDGWYCGRIGVTGDNCQYGDRHALLLEMVIEYTDGNITRIVSDEDFRCSTGPIVYSDLFIGEKYDARIHPEEWRGVTVENYGYEQLQAFPGDPVRRVMEIRPRAVLKTPKGETLIDLGQNIAGRMKMRVQGKTGTEVTLEHSETLDEQGNFTMNILGRNKDQTVKYVLSGGETEIYEPCFTFHGFRYVRVTGYPGAVTKENFTGIVLGSDMTRTGGFECSDPLLNQLQSNIFWSQRANMISIPTDCPQRERAGWTGDIQVFAPTAGFNMDTSAFLERWLKSVRTEQFADGQIPMIVPYIDAYKQSVAKMFKTGCSCGWGDACIIVPLALYRIYGDINVLRENYDMMKGWMRYIENRAYNYNPPDLKMNPLYWTNRKKREHSKYLWNTKFHFGDWLIPSKSGSGVMGMIQGAYATKRMAASAYYAYSTGLMAEIAGILGSAADQKKYGDLNAKIKEAFAGAYISKKGRIKPNLQGAYVLALQFGLVPERLKNAALNRLVALIHANGKRLDTGFLSMPFLLDVLWDNGHKDLAYTILRQDKCPSWLYEIKNGATTIWESWKAITPEGKITNVSYNHYAFGCVGGWMYRKIGGLYPLEPGYKKILMRPEPDERLSSAKTSLHTVYGKAVCEWKREKDKFHVRVEIPCNTRALAVLPDGVSHEVGSGTYEFTCNR